MKSIKNDVKLSKFLSLVLRHRPEAAGVTLDEHGWAEVRALLRGVCGTGRQIDMETLERIVREDDKQRYSFNKNHNRIRAKPPRYLYHGTAVRFLPAIQAEGIKKMTRQYVHLSGDRETAVAVGRRYGAPVVLRVEAEAMALSGITFYRSENGVWLCDYVPLGYFCVLRMD